MNKASQELGEAEGPQVLPENVAGSGPWEERVSLEIQDQMEEPGAWGPVGRRERTDEMDLAVTDAKAKKEKEDFLDTLVQRESPVSQEQGALQGPKAPEAEGEIQDLQARSDRRETLGTQDHPVPKVTKATRSINVPLSRASKINVLAATGPWNAPSSRRNWPLL